MDEAARQGLNALEELGLTPQQAEVYVLLLRRGPLGAAEIADAVDVPRTRVYELTKALQEQGLVAATLEAPRRFRSREIRHFVEDERQRLQAEQAALEARLPELERLLPVARKEAAGSSGAFTPLTGAHRVSSRLAAFLKDADQKILLRGGREGYRLVDSLIDACGSGVDVRVLHEVDEEALDPFLRLEAAGAVMRHSLSPEHLTVVIVDDKQCLIVFPPGNGKQSTSGLWTDEPHFVAAQVSALEAAWTSGITLEQRKRQLEAGEAPRTTELLRAASDHDPRANARVFLDSAIRLIADARTELEIALPLEAVRLMDWDRLYERLEFIDCRLLLPVPEPGTPEAAMLTRLTDVVEVREAPVGLQHHATLVRDGEECIIAVLDLRPDEDAPRWESVIVSNERGLVSASRAPFDLFWDHALGIDEAAIRSDSGEWWYTSYRQQDAMGWAREALTAAGTSVTVHAPAHLEGLLTSLLKSTAPRVRVETTLDEEGSTLVIIVDEGLCVVIEKPRATEDADGALRLESIGFALFTNSAATLRSWKQGGPLQSRIGPP